MSAAEKRQAAWAALDEARRRSRCGDPDFGFTRRVPGETDEGYAFRIQRILDARAEAGRAAESAVSPAWRKVALLWAADKRWPLFVSLGSAAAFACGAPEWGYGLLIGWAIGTVLS